MKRAFKAIIFLIVFINFVAFLVLVQPSITGFTVYSTANEKVAFSWASIILITLLVVSMINIYGSTDIEYELSQPQPTQQQLQPQQETQQQAAPQISNTHYQKREEYISTCLSQGLNEEEIKDILTNAGWSKEVVDEMMSISM